MKLRVSFSLALFLALLTGTTLSKCVIAPDAGNRPEPRKTRENAPWPRTYLLSFQVRDEGLQSLGDRSEVLGPNMTFAPPACSRLKLAAERSGETYAGHMIRERMRYGACRKYAGLDKKNWNWPWSKGVPRGDLPPELRGVYGAWQLRCADSNRKKRCALVQTSQPDNQGASALTTHFTMTRVRGKTIPLWRVWVPKTKANWFSGLTPEGYRQWDRMLSDCLKKRIGFSRCLNSARERFHDRRTREIWFSSAYENRNLNFTKCTDQGCMVETPIGMSVQAYSNFIRGQNVSIKIHPLGDMPVQFEINSNGFHAALDALSLLDRLDKSVQAVGKKKAL